MNTAAAEAQSDSSEGPPSPLPSSPFNEDELELISALVRGRFARRGRGKGNSMICNEVQAGLVLLCRYWIGNT